MSQYIHLTNYPMCVYSIASYFVKKKNSQKGENVNFETVNFPFLDGDIVRCIYIAANLFC